MPLTVKGAANRTSDQQITATENREPKTYSQTIDLGNVSFTRQTQTELNKNCQAEIRPGVDEL